MSLCVQAYLFPLEIVNSSDTSCASVGNRNWFYFSFHCVIPFDCKAHMAEIQISFKYTQQNNK